MRLMLDTNIIIDVLTRREPFFEASYAVLRLAATERHECFLSASAATDVYYLLKRALKSDGEARERMETLLQLVCVADALGEDVYSALSSDMADFEDALVAAIARRAGMRYIVTRNLRDYEKSPVRAIAPEELLRLN